MNPRRQALFTILILATGAGAAFGAAQSGPIEPDSVIDFESVKLGTPANGLSLGGVTFSFNLNPGRSNTAYGILPSAAVGNDFPQTPTIGGKGIQGSPFGSLGLKFDRPVSSLSFGFGLHAAGGNQFFGDGSVRNAVVVDLFDPKGGFIGSFSNDGKGFIPDEEGKESDDRFATDRGGGAEYNTGLFAASSEIRIGSASVRFATEGLPATGLRQNSGGVPIDLFFFDNLSFIPTTIPLPTPLLLSCAGLVAFASLRRRRGL